MSEYEFLVPELEWKLMRHQRQEQAEVAEDDRNQNQNRIQQRDTNNSNGSSHSHVQQQQHRSINFHQYHHSSVPIPMSMKNIHQIEELTWENGQLAMHGHGGSVLPAAPPKPIWSSSDTLESIVHQASSSSLKHARFHADDIVPTMNLLNPTCINKGSSSGDLGSDRIVQSNPRRTKSQNTVPVLKKRARSGSAPYGKAANNLLSTSCSYRNDQDERKTKNIDRSMCGSASATFWRDDHDPTMMTWASFESPRSFKMMNQSADEDSAASPGGSENQDEDQDTKTETGRSHSNKRSRAAAIHNQSERRRRDRINEKMKTLQRLVPNARKTDKASMLDEVIEYLKQLQAQVQMMNTMRNISSLPQLTMMPIGLTPQQQLQMSLLSRMSAGGVGFGLGMGMGMGVIDINSMARVPAHPQALSPLLHPASAAAATAFASTPQLMVPPTHAPSSAQTSSDAGNNASFHFPEAYCALLAQKMNIELYDKMATLYRQQTTGPPANTNEARRD